MKQTSVKVDSPVGLSRRQFLKTGSGVLMGTLAASSGVLATLAPSRSWALTLSTLSDRRRQVVEGYAWNFPARHAR